MYLENAQKKLLELLIVLSSNYSLQVPAKVGPRVLVV